MTKKLKKILAGVLLSILVSVGIAGFALLGSLETTNQKLTHSLYNGRETTDEIVIVAIDNLSLGPKSEGGLDQLGNWPYDYYAKALNHIEKGDPGVVMMDVLFAEESSFLPLDDITDLAQQNLKV